MKSSLPFFDQFLSFTFLKNRENRQWSLCNKKIIRLVLHQKMGLKKNIKRRNEIIHIFLQTILGRRITQTSFYPDFESNGGVPIKDDWGPNVNWNGRQVAEKKKKNDPHILKVILDHVCPQKDEKKKKETRKWHHSIFTIIDSW